MIKSLSVLACVAAVATVLWVQSAPHRAFAAEGGTPLFAELNGANEVPGPGDPDGSGTAELTLNSGLEQICFDIEVFDIATATAAHIHSGTADVPGPVVVNFDVGNNGLSGCVDAERQLIKDIRKNPGNYYVNVHNADFPPGAVRGQLE